MDRGRSPGNGRRLAGGLLLAAAGAGLLGAALLLRAPSGDLAARELTTAIEQQLRERAAGLASRVNTLSQLPRLAAAVATDEATVRDLTEEELAFRPQPGETLTISQRFADGRSNHLLTLPAGAPPMARTSPGLELMVDARRLVLAHTARIVPRERAGELAGLLTATTPADLDEVKADLLKRGVGGRLEVDGSPLALADASPERAGEELSWPLSLPQGTRGEARLVLTGMNGGLPPLALQGLGGLGALFIVLAMVIAFPRPVGAASPSLPSASPTSSSSMALTPTEFAGPSIVRNATSPPASGGAALALAVAVPAQRGGRPTRIGRYQILRQLGAGGMAEVYLARGEGEAGFEKLVALKVLQPALAVRPAVVEVFLDEARVAAGLNHPNIVQTHDLGRWGEDYFIAMEFIDGTDLSRLGEILRERGQLMPLPVAVAILRKLCDGLHAAHEALASDGGHLELVHRDVKAANVFVSRAGATKIGDFGIARISHAMRMGKTDIGQVKGTPAYMAPEHRVGADVDRRADVFGVAAVAYELFTGKPVNLDTVLLIARGLEGWPHLPPVDSLRPGAPAALDDLVKRGLAYERDQRIADCAAFEQELEQLAKVVGVADDKAVGRFVTEQLRWAEQSAPPA